MHPCIGASLLTALAAAWPCTPLEPRLPSWCWWSLPRCCREAVCACSCTDGSEELEVGADVHSTLPLPCCCACVLELRWRPAGAEGARGSGPAMPFPVAARVRSSAAAAVSTSIVRCSHSFILLIRLMAGTRPHQRCTDRR